MSQCDRSMKELYNMGFRETDDWKDISKSKSKDDTTALICNSYGKFYLGECWRTKPRVCFYCRQPRHFILDYPRKKYDEECQMMRQSSARENISQNHHGKGLRKRGNGNNTTISNGS